MRGIHDRMPVIIQRKDESAWLDPTLKSDRVMPLPPTFGANLYVRRPISLFTMSH